MSVPGPPSPDGVLTGPPGSLEARELMPGTCGRARCEWVGPASHLPPGSGGGRAGARGGEAMGPGAVGDPEGEFVGALWPVVDRLS